MSNNCEKDSIQHLSGTHLAIEQMIKRQNAITAGIKASEAVIDLQNLAKKMAMNPNLKFYSDKTFAIINALRKENERIENLKNITASINIPTIPESILETNAILQGIRLSLSVPKDFSDYFDYKSPKNYEQNLPEKNQPKPRVFKGATNGAKYKLSAKSVKKIKHYSLSFVFVFITSLIQYYLGHDFRVAIGLLPILTVLIEIRLEYSNNDE